MLRFYAAVAALFLVVIMASWQQYSSWKVQRSLVQELEQSRASYAALQGELQRTRMNVLLASQNASERRTELSRAIQTEEEWSATEVPESVRRALRGYAAANGVHE